MAASTPATTHDTIVLADEPIASFAGRSIFKTAREFFRDIKAMIGGALLALFLVLAIGAPVLAPFGETEQHPEQHLQGPSMTHPMGTDRLGRDIFSRVIYGTRVSLLVGLAAVGVAVVVGVPVGLISGYLGGWTDEISMRLVDAWIAFPGLILVLGLMAVLGAGLLNVTIAIGLISFPVLCRLIRSQTLSVKNRDFVDAARALGASDRRVVFAHILPNAIQPIIVQASLLAGFAVLTEASLSFLGVGVRPPKATWGSVIQEGFSVIRIEPWGAIAPGLALMLFVLMCNLLGDRLRDFLDPRLRGTR